MIHLKVLKKQQEEIVLRWQEINYQTRGKINKQETNKPNTKNKGNKDLDLWENQQTSSQIKQKTQREDQN